MTILIEWDKVNDLRNDVGIEDFDEVLELFLDEVEDTLAVLGQPNRELEHDLHFLKGAALNLGFAQFSDLCRDGEAAAARSKDALLDLRAISQSYEVSKKLFLSEFIANVAS
ncbi:MAG: Hpt domain-containing protein [Paracoccaceae bacterium]